MINKINIKKNYKGMESFGGQSASSSEQMKQNADIAKMMQEARKNQPQGETAPKSKSAFGGPKSESKPSESMDLSALATKIVQAPIEMAKKVPTKVVKSTRPWMVNFDDSFESIILSGPAKIKSIFSGIGNFFKSIPASLGFDSSKKEK